MKSKNRERDGWSLQRKLRLNQESQNLTIPYISPKKKEEKKKKTVR